MAIHLADSRSDNERAIIALVNTDFVWSTSEGNTASA